MRPDAVRQPVVYRTSREVCLHDSEAVLNPVSFVCYCQDISRRILKICGCGIITVILFFFRNLRFVKDIFNDGLFEKVMIKRCLRRPAAFTRLHNGKVVFAHSFYARPQNRIRQKEFPVLALYR